MPRDRKQYNKDMTKQKIAYRSAPKLFRTQQSLFHGKPIRQEPVSSTISTEQIPGSPALND
ncbi:MAG: hypothetical protein WC527_02300 [Candidatus Margulisiibacteriota bacterium]